MSLSCYNAVKRTIDSWGTRPKSCLNYMDAVFIGDRSYSMIDMGEAPFIGAVTFMEKYKNFSEEVPDSNIHVEFISFDDKHEVLFSGSASDITSEIVKEVEYGMTPRGSTRLYDTVIYAIRKQAKRVQRHKDTWSSEVRKLNPEIGVTLTVLTDGEDNTSSTTAWQMRMCIEIHRKFDAKCFFAAANQDALRVGEEYGFDRESSLQIGSNPEEAVEAFRACTNSSLRCATQENMGYTSAEREASCNPFDYTYNEESYDEKIHQHYPSGPQGYSDYDSEDEGEVFCGKAVRC